MAPRPIEGCHGFARRSRSPDDNRPGHGDEAEVVVRQRLQDDIPAGRGECQSALGGGDGLVMRAHKVETGDRKSETCPMPTWVVEGCREGFRLAQVRSGYAQVARRQKRSALGESEIDRLLARVVRLRQMREGAERLLERPHGLSVGRPRHGLLPRLSAVRQGLVPHLAPQGMVRQAFNLFGHPLGSERLQGLHNLGMQRPPPLLQEATVGHLVGQGMLEGVLTFRKEPRLVEKLSRLEMREAAVHSVFGHLGNSLQQRQGHLDANDRRGLQELFFL